MLACLGYDVTSIDVDEDMLRRAMANASLFEKIGIAPVRFEFGDTFNLSKYYRGFDLAFSSGLIEHFRFEQAVQAIREQAKTAKYVVVAVPTKYLNEPFEVPRYPYTLRSLESLCRRAGLLTVQKLAFGDPPHQALRTLRQLTPSLIWNVVFRKLFATSAACICQTL